MKPLINDYKNKYACITHLKKESFDTEIYNIFALSIAHNLPSIYLHCYKTPSRTTKITLHVTPFPHATVRSGIK